MLMLVVSVNPLVNALFYVFHLEIALVKTKKHQLLGPINGESSTVKTINGESSTVKRVLLRTINSAHLDSLVFLVGILHFD